MFNGLWTCGCVEACVCVCCSVVFVVSHARVCVKHKQHLITFRPHHPPVGKCSFVVLRGSRHFALHLCFLQAQGLGRFWGTQKQTRTNDAVRTVISPQSHARVREVCQIRPRYLKTTAKVWYKFPDCGTRERWLLFATGLWMVAVISYSFWMVAWMPALITRRLLGTMEIRLPRPLKSTSGKRALDLLVLIFFLQ